MDYKINNRSTEGGNPPTKWGISADHFATVMEAMPIGIAVAGRDGKVIVCNEELHGFLPTGILPFKDDNRYWRWRSLHRDGQLLKRHEFPGACALRSETVFPGMDMLTLKFKSTNNNTSLITTTVCCIQDSYLLA